MRCYVYPFAVAVVFRFHSPVSGSRGPGMRAGQSGSRKLSPVIPLKLNNYLEFSLPGTMHSGTGLETYEQRVRAFRASMICFNTSMDKKFLVSRDKGPLLWSRANSLKSCGSNSKGSKSQPQFLHSIPMNKGRLSLHSLLFPAFIGLMCPYSHSRSSANPSEATSTSFQSL